MLKLNDIKKRKIKIIGTILFISYIFGLCFSWSLSTEYNSAPDEYMKYDVCTYICNNLKLPHGGDESIRNPIWGISYAFTPILSYIFSALFMRFTMLFTQNTFIILISARFISVLCITGYAIMCTKIANKLFKGVYKWLFIVFVTLLPQLVYLGSYINNDSLALFSISIIVYSWIIGLENDWDWKSCIIMAIGIGICALSYYNAYGYILCSVIIYFISSYIKKMDITEFLKKGTIIILIVFAIAGWWFIRNFVLYNGDFLGLNTSNEYSQMYAQEEYKPSNRNTPAHRKISLKYMLKDMNWIKITKTSFIGQFGYMSVLMNKKIYRAYELIGIIGIIGIICGVVLQFIRKIIQKTKNNSINKVGKKTYESILFNSIMIICIVIPIVLSIYYSYFSDFQPQGRYIMAILIPLMYFIVIGFKNLFDSIIKNKVLKNLLLIAIILVWSVMPIYIFFTYIRAL